MSVPSHALLWLASSAALVGCSDRSRSDRAATEAKPAGEPTATIPGLANPTWPNVGPQPDGEPPLQWWLKPAPCPRGTILVREKFGWADEENDRDEHEQRREGYPLYSLEEPHKRPTRPVPVLADDDPLLDTEPELIDRLHQHDPYADFRPLRDLGATYFYCTHEDGRLAGPWSALHRDDSTWYTGWYMDDQRHGRFRAFSPQGNQLGSFEMVHGTGQWTTWNENGKIIHQGRYVSGRMQGEWSFWYDNGQLELQSRFERGKPVGAIVEWHRDGTKALEGQYKDGDQTGIWREWDPDGTLTRTTKL